MTLQQLKYVITVAEKGSITESAKELYISQPSLSGAIKEVEKEAKLTIFNRCRAGVALTTEGMEFWSIATHILAGRQVFRVPKQRHRCCPARSFELPLIDLPQILLS